MEPELRERLKSRITRGKVECNLQLRFGGENFGLAIDESLLERLDEALTMIAAKTRAELSLSAIELLRWPGVLREQSIDGEELEAMALAGFEAALEKLDEGRAREGGKLCALVLARIDGIDLQLGRFAARPAGPEGGSAPEVRRSACRVSPYYRRAAP